MRHFALKFAVLTALLISFSFSSYGKSYYGGATQELQGPVKSVKYKTQNPFMLKKSFGFLPDGRQKMSTWVYNEEGYPFAMGFLTSPSNWYNYLVTYNNAGKIEKMVYESAQKNGDSKMNFIYTYGDQKLTKTDVYAISDNDQKLIMTFEYSDEKFDSHGNWIERNVKLTDFANGTTNTSDYVETRKIEYYQ